MINGKIMITSKSDKLNIDNEAVSIDVLKRKLTEEYDEVIKEKNPKELAAELMDLIQISLAMLWKLKADYLLDLEGVFKRHYWKLKNRGWKAAANIYFMVVKDNE